MSETDAAQRTEALLVLTTTDSAEAAAQLSQQLVEQNLAACVQIVAPIKSVYRWQGKIETASEFLLLIKTTCATYPALAAQLKVLHNYQTPEIIALPVVAGSSDYLTWLQTAVKGTS